jgi:hypothetical protein
VYSSRENAYEAKRAGRSWEVSSTNPAWPETKKIVVWCMYIDVHHEASSRDGKMMLSLRFELNRVALHCYAMSCEIDQQIDRSFILLFVSGYLLLSLIHSSGYDMPDFLVDTLRISILVQRNTVCRIGACISHPLTSTHSYPCSL